MLASKSEKNPDILDLVDANKEFRCEKRVYEDEETRGCKVSRPITNSLRSSLNLEVAEWRRSPTCGVYWNEGILWDAGFEEEDIKKINLDKPTYVQECCVQTCLLDISIPKVEYRIGYFVSGTKKVNKDDGNTVNQPWEVGKCPDCWGTAIVQRVPNTEYGRICKEGETMRVELNLPPSLLANPNS